MRARRRWAGFAHCQCPPFLGVERESSATEDSIVRWPLTGCDVVCRAELATAAAATHNWAAQPHVAEYLYGKLLAHFDTHLIGLLPSKL